MNHRRRLLYRSLYATAVCALLFQWVTHSTGAVRNHQAAALAPKYIFLFLADGGGIPHMEITRQYNRLLDEGMVIPDNIMKEGVLGLITTHPADSLSTDSAAAATALASGCKAKIGALGMCADGTVPKTAMEVAKERGMRIGLVTNSTVYDASPAAFLCHVPSRKHFGAIVNRYLELEPEVLLGGGRDQFLPTGRTGGARNDDTDMIASFQQKGYRYAWNKQELAKATGGRVLGLFNLREMSFELDRDRGTEPSLYDMTQTAIGVLREGNSRGFFVFIESENIDSASHLTDVASVIHGYREFDRAVGLAYEFYKKHPDETLIIVTSDHESGGLGFVLALKDLSSTAGSNQVDGKLEDLRKLQSIPISLRKASEILGPRPTGEAIDNLMKNYFKGFTLAPEFKEAIMKRQPISRTIFSDPTTNALGMMVANNTQAYWLTTAHTNHPVFVAALGRGAERFRGYHDNSDFGKNLKAILAGERSPVR
jgi:alkaline phosphatase